MSATDILLQLVQSWGYPGAFLMGFVSSATVFLPTPAFIVVFIMAAPQFGLNPFWLGIVSGTGAAIGELVGYYLAYAGSGLFLCKYDKYAKDVKNLEKKFRKYGADLIVFLFAVTPAPFDIVGLLCGAIKYSVKRFFIATLFGKWIKYLFISYAGYYSMEWFIKLFGG